MVRLQHRVVLPAGWDEVVALVHDWSRDGEWRAVMSMAVDPPGPAVAGQRVFERLRFAGIVFETPTTIEQVSEPASGSAPAPSESGPQPEVARTVVFAGGSGVLGVRGTRTVRAVDPEHTELLTDVHLELHGPLRLLTRPLARAYDRRVDTELVRLTRRLAAGSKDRCGR